MSLQAICIPYRSSKYEIPGNKKVKEMHFKSLRAFNDETLLFLKYSLARV